MPKYQVLSLDGGGVRGLLTARLLHRLTTEFPELTKVFDSVDLIAGNSSGSLIALAMARARAGKVPMSTALKEIVEVFEDGPSVFGPRRWGSLGFILTNRYGSTKKEEALEKHLRNTKLSELGTSVLITTFDVFGESIDELKASRRDDALDSAERRWKAKIFHNFKRANLFQPVDKSSDREQLAREVALYSTAAPAFFPTANGYVDGGVYANNPSMCALAQLYDNRYEPMPKRPLTDIVMFSVGAGLNTVSVKRKTNRWGLLQWFLPIRFERPVFQDFNRNFVAMVSDATVGIADYQCRQMLGDENYRRLQVTFESHVAFDIDATDKIDEIRKIANDFKLESHAEWLSRYWMPRKPLVPVLSDATSKHILGTVELTVLMPIKQGFVDVFETHTYATRLRGVLRGLHALRQASREACDVRVFPDIVDLIGSIHAFHLSIVQSRQLLLTVTFDRPWEPYFRLVWSRLGALLDLILINCEGYEKHVSSLGYDHFIAWVRHYQVEAELFYAASPHTVDDLSYLRDLERTVRVNPSANLTRSAALLTTISPVESASRSAKNHHDEMIHQGLIALASFYKLRDLYRDGTPDAEFLRAAVFATLSTLDLSHASAEQSDEFCREIEWFEQIVHSRNRSLPASVLGQIGQRRGPDSVRTPEFAQIQAGIVNFLPRVTHGVLLLARVENPKLAREFLGRTLVNKVAYQQREADPDVFVTAALTFEGLKRLGLSDEELAVFPKEFREGMEARAGMLGDVRSNHPTNWELPVWNWGPSTTAEPLPRVRLSTVDLVIQLRSTNRATASDDWNDHPLRIGAEELMGDPETTGIRVMSRQIMTHHRDKSTGRVREHFGFIDGISQPERSDPPAPTDVPLGEFVLGYENARGDMPFPDRDNARAAPGRTRGSWLDNGSFLVVRKLEQHVDVFNEMKATIGRGGLAKLMGRTLDGQPLTTPETAVGRRGLRHIPNDFTYEHDKGDGCPLHAHIRRANPRTESVPRIARRGMAYGPRWDDDPKAERGMMFLAYNASIAEQFETVQRWMTGGNSTGGFSGSADPFLRVPQTGEDEVFLAPLENDDVMRIQLPSQPLVSLKWGLYAFVPSKEALTKLAEKPLADEAKRLAALSVGERMIMSLQTDEEWSTILEDSSAIHSGRTAAVFAAIREFHGGVYRTRGGTLVIVASRQAFETVLKPEKDPVYSVSEYKKRMATSIGEIYLGMDESDDEDDEYRALSAAPNDAISQITIDDAFTKAHQKAAACIRKTLRHAKDEQFRLSLEPIVDTTLGRLAEEFFGIPDTVLVQSGGRPDDSGTDRSVRCPFHTLAPSRFIFSSPNPRDNVRKAGSALGAALRVRIRELAEQKSREGVWPKALEQYGISHAVWNTSLVTDKHGDKVIDHDLFARMMVGMLEGFLPTVYGNALKILHLWLTDGTFWRVQQDLLVTYALSTYDRATIAVLPAIRRAMQTRPVPDIIHRTATRKARLGDVQVDEGDRIVLSIASVVQELAEKGVDDVYPVFGGNRDETNHPTHACPGYDMGLGATLGILTAVLEAGEFAPNPTPLVVELSRVEDARSSLPDS